MYFSSLPPDRRGRQLWAEEVAALKLLRSELVLGFCLSETTSCASQLGELYPGATLTLHFYDERDHHQGFFSSEPQAQACGALGPLSAPPHPEPRLIGDFRVLGFVGSICGCYQLLSAALACLSPSNTTCRRSLGGCTAGKG
mmetsp:Transcript_4219/g.6655  ORF Transcript_4219/g.6655 Transcript_4219/m.6655 type:complete len:142 (+) Transcript_4219:703-1128(+)